MRTGIGYDVHRFAEGRKLMLGGVEIPHTMGLEGHSDADVLLHSLCDALLGAAGFEDIGHQFPNTDNRFKDISSLLLLKSTMELLTNSGWHVVNTDSVVILEAPKIYPFIPQMKSEISAVVNCANVSVKATTSEGLGFAGKGEGCSAYSTVLIAK
ncbi:MAG: 2-C-methyl-D-erythritol 2,4-cyclodiphosphate synthase [Ignavibacteria bacterium]|nr:2-C-methyl-D-erythritol 2,4-cyclodiphosphate synthase [Ignavibacteria bacterium]